MFYLQPSSTQICFLMALISKQLRENKISKHYHFWLKEDCKRLGEVYKVLYSQLFPDSPKLARYRIRLEKKFTKPEIPY
jgi:rRNA maturation protein Nop10